MHDPQGSARSSCRPGTGGRPTPCGLQSGRALHGNAHILTTMGALQTSFSFLDAPTGVACVYALVLLCAVVLVYYFPVRAGLHSTAEHRAAPAGEPGEDAPGALDDLQGDPWPIY